MSPPTMAAPTPTPLLRRVATWWLAQMRHALPPTIFFFVGFNLILWTKRLILQEHGIEFSGFFTALVAALLIGKAVLVTDNLPFMRRFDGAPMIQPILFKSAIYWLCVLVVRSAEELGHFVAAGGAFVEVVGDLLLGAGAEVATDVLAHPGLRPAALATGGGLEVLVEEPAYERRPYWNGFGGIDQEMTVASKRREHLKFRFPACSTERIPFLRASLSSGIGC